MADTTNRQQRRRVKVSPFKNMVRYKLNEAILQKGSNNLSLYYRRLICNPLMAPLLKIVKTTVCLQALSLGCAEDLAASSGLILESLRHHHTKNLLHLSLASVKDDPDDYVLLELDTSVFRSFTRLSFLTLDYDYVSDALLKALDSGFMERLVIHVHGLEDNHPGTTNNAWLSFVDKK